MKFEGWIDHKTKILQELNVNCDDVWRLNDFIYSEDSVFGILFYFEVMFRQIFG